MLGQTIGQIKRKEIAETTGVADRTSASGRCRRDVEATIEGLHALSRRGLWWILSFLTVSALTLYCREAGVFALVPPEIKVMFGDPPPLQLLNVVLAVSWLSALVLILGRRGGDGRPRYRWYNVVLPTVFYPLYTFSDPSGAHFPAVFAAGLILLVIEHATVVRYAARTIREETERLETLKR